MAPDTQPLFTLRTDEIVGREKELAKLTKVLSELRTTGDRTLFFYIAGDGGMGKTRLLQWVKAQPLPSKTFCTTVLDFYHSTLPTDVDLVEQIFDDTEAGIEKLPLDLRWGFERYKVLRNRYHRQEVGATGQQGRVEVIQAFNDAWSPLAKAGYRLVVLLDTAEFLRFEDDEVRAKFDKFGAAMPIASAKQWLEAVMAGASSGKDETLPGVLFIVAGRRKEDETLYQSLARLAAMGAPNADTHLINLAGLDRQGIDTYLDALANKLTQKGLDGPAEQLRELDSARRQALFQVTLGSPIALALALQIYIDQTSSELDLLIEEQLAFPEQPVSNAEKRLQAALVKALAEQQTFQAASTAIRYMSLARKGLTPTRLCGLLNSTNQSHITVNFTDLKDLIFVKELPDGSLVLHDKMADWTEEGLYGASKERSHIVYQKLIELYDQEIAELDRKIDDLTPNADPIESDLYDTTEMQEDPFAHENSWEFRHTRHQRRNLLIERMAYVLRAAPLTGYKQYFKLAEEAFNAGRMDYESQIRAEFLGWWNHEEPVKSGLYKYRQQAADVGVSKAIIEADFAIRMIQREYNRELPEISPTERMIRTVNLVEQILLEINAGHFDVPIFVRNLIRVYGETAKGQLAKSEEQITQVRSEFRDQIDELEALLSDSTDDDHEDVEEQVLSIEQFLTLNALAFAHYELGFFESNYGNHGNAIANYTSSLLPYRDLGLEINLARSLNDKAYSSAMVGDSDSAETTVEEALRLRKRLGFSYLIALSYNTLGIVHTLGERPITAVRYCDYALRTFIGLNHEYGQMIASRALSEAHRRIAEYLHSNRGEQLSALERALTASQTALALAEKLLSDKDSLLAEVRDECGCVYRDLARFRFQNLDLLKDKKDNHEKAYGQSTQLIDAAIALAQGVPGARTHLVDFMINRAYLSFYRLNAETIDDQTKATFLNETWKLVTDAITEVPNQYRTPSAPDHNPNDLVVYWGYLSKAHALRVHCLRNRLELLKSNVELKPERIELERELLREAIYTLYFRSLLRGNMRYVRKSHQAVFDAFNTFSGFTLRRLRKEAPGISQEAGIPEGIILGFFKNDCGLG